MKIKNKINDNIILSFFFGMPLIIFILWNRLIRIRVPKEITPLNELFCLYSYIIIFLICLYLVLFIYYLKNYLKFSLKKKSKIMKIIEKIDYYIQSKKILKEIYLNFLLIYNQHIHYGPHRIYDRILYKKIKIFKNYLDYINDFIAIKLHVTLWKNKKTKEEIEKSLKLFFVFFLVIPRVIPVIVFCYEVLINQYLNFFYQSLILLLFPLSVNFFLFTMKHSVETRMDNISFFYKIEHKIYDLEGKIFEIKIEKKNDNIAFSSDNEERGLEMKKLYQNEEFIKFAWIDLQIKYNIISQIEITIDHYKNRLKIFLSFFYLITFFFYFLTLAGYFSQDSFQNLLSSLYYYYITYFKKNNQFYYFSCFSFFILIFSLILNKIYFYIYLYVYIKPFIEKLINFFDKILFPFFKSFLFFNLLLLIILINNFCFSSFFFLLIFYQIFYLLIRVTEEHSYHLLKLYNNFFTVTIDEERNTIKTTIKELTNEEKEKFLLYDPLDKNGDVALFIINDWEIHYDNLNNIKEFKEKLQKIFIFLFIIMVIFIIGYILYTKFFEKLIN